MAYVELILDHGWPHMLVGIDVFRDRFDVGVFHERDLQRLYLAGETKASDREIRKLLRQMQRCCDASCRPRLRRYTTGKSTPDGHKKYVGLLEFTPTLFWAAGPHESHLFPIEPQGVGVKLIEAGEAPTLP